MMTFRTAPGKTELHLKNIATAWEHQLKLAVKKGVLVDYKVLTKWSSNPDDWNIMVIEMFPNMASYDTFWEDWAAIDVETVDKPEFRERLNCRYTIPRYRICTRSATEAAIGKARSRRAGAAASGR
jgi:hypothetical protein